MLDSSWELHDAHRDFLVEAIASGTRGHADLAAYFFLRGTELLREGGLFVQTYRKLPLLGSTVTLANDTIQATGDGGHAVMATQAVVRFQ